MCTQWWGKKEACRAVMRQGWGMDIGHNDTCLQPAGKPSYWPMIHRCGPGLGDPLPTPSLGPRGPGSVPDMNDHNKLLDHMLNLDAIISK